MRYRWDPAYPMGRRDTQAYDAAMRASDDERNAVADKLSRHYAEGRLDEVEFKNRLDTAMSATTRGDLNGLFDDLPRLPSEPPPPPPRHRRILPWVLVVVLVAIAAGATMPFYPLYHVPWFLFAIVGLLRLAAGRGAPPPHHHRHDGPGGRARSWTTEATCMHTAPAHGQHHAATGRRPGHAALPGPLRRPARRRARGDRGALRRVHRASRGRSIQAQDVPVRMWHVITGGHAVVQRDGTPIGLLGPGRLVVGALAPQPAALVHRRRGALTPHPADPQPARLLRDPGAPSGPGRTPGGPVGHLGRPSGPPCVQCPGPSGRYRVHRRVSGGPVRLTLSPVTPAGGRVEHPRGDPPNAHPGRVVCPSSPHRRPVVDARPRRLDLLGGGRRHQLLEQLQLPPHPVLRRHQPAEVRRALPLRRPGAGRLRHVR